MEHILRMGPTYFSAYKVTSEDILNGSDFGSVHNLEKGTKEILPQY